MGVEEEMDWQNGRLLSSSDKHGEKDKILGKLYSTARRSTLIQVYQKYKFDYEVFGYDFNDVLKLAGYQLLTDYEKSLQPTFY